MENISQIIARALNDIHRQKPLIHHITNFVVMNETANLTLCLGALPVMSHAREEVAEMVEASGALLLNIGTLTSELVNSMIVAGKAANELNIPVILDPVGAGATSLRTESAKRLLNELKIAVVRGNAAEIGILAGYGGEIKGVESAGGDDDVERIAKDFASLKGVVAAITGKIDVVSDGRRVAIVKNGHPMLGRVTGTGCMATTVVAAFCAVEKDYFVATFSGLSLFGLTGELAAQTSGNLVGTFHTKIYDILAEINEEQILKGCKVGVKQE